MCVIRASLHKHAWSSRRLCVNCSTVFSHILASHVFVKAIPLIFGRQRIMFTIYFIKTRARNLHSFLSVPYIYSWSALMFCRIHPRLLDLMIHHTNYSFSVQNIMHLLISISQKEDKKYMVVQKWKCILHISLTRQKCLKREK